jgi:hypothetical protein
LTVNRKLHHAQTQKFARLAGVGLDGQRLRLINRQEGQGKAQPRSMGK